LLIRASAIEGPQSYDDVTGIMHIALKTGREFLPLSHLAAISALSM
jgi:hypothetical protein